MEVECLPFTAVPHSTPLFSDFLYHFPRVEGFYARPTLDADSVRTRAAALNFPVERRQQIAAILDRQNRSWDAPPAALGAIERLRDGAAAIVTGQQIGLFGGPSFGLYKALTAIKVAGDLSRSGVDCVPVFWLATEDHDFAEISAAEVLDDRQRLVRMEVQPRAAADGPVGRIALDAQISALCSQLAEVLGRSDAVEILQRSYRPGVTLGESFARLFTALLGRFGLVLLDPDDAEVHRLAQPLLGAALERAPEIGAALTARGRELEQRGYDQQVNVTDASTLLFAMENGTRVPVHRGNGGFAIAKRKISPQELQQRLAAQPEEFSGNVLLRPVMQDFLLPSVAYIGGPSEIAYFAQAAVVYEKLLGRATPIVHRFSATLVEPRTKRLLDRYGVRVTDLFHGAERTRELLAARNLPRELDQAFAAAETARESSLEKVLAQLQKLDPTLVEAGKRAASKMRYQLGRLQGRAARAALRRSAELEAHADQLSSALYPHKALQERTVAGVTWMARYGPDVLDRLLGLVNPGCADHQIVYL